MTNRKIIAVIGATGAQGGGLVRAIVDDPRGGFAARAVSRDLRSGAAQALADRGAELVAADLDDVDSLKRALDGAYGVFCVTPFWAHFSPERELAQATAMATAACATGVQHAIWSTLEDTRHWISLDDDRMPTLQGKYKVPHFDMKGAADEVFRKLGVPTTFLRTSFYYDNLISFGMGPKKNPRGEGSLVFGLPLGQRRLPAIAAEDIGRCAFGIFTRGAEYIDKTVAIAGEHLTGEEFAAALTKALGRPVSYHAISFDDYRQLGFPGAEDLGNMFQFKHDFQDVFCGPRDPKIARELNPHLQTFAEWLERNAQRIPLE